MFSIIRQLFTILALLTAFNPQALADDAAAENKAEIKKLTSLRDDALETQELETAIKHQEAVVFKIHAACEKFTNEELRSQSYFQSDLLTALKAAAKLSKEKQEKFFSVRNGFISAIEFEAKFKYLESIEVLSTSIDTYNKHLTASDMHYFEYGLHGTLGRAYADIGELEKSVEAFSRVREIRIKHYQESRPDLMGECLHLSECKMLQGDHASADLYCREYLERELRASDDYGAHYAAGLAVLAMIHLSNNRTAEAEAFSLTALGCLQKLTERPTYAAARSYLSLAEVYMLRGAHEKSKHLFQRSLRTYKEVAGENSFQFAEAIKKYAVLLKVMGDGEEAQKLTNEANEMTKYYKDKLREMSKQ